MKLAAVALRDLARRIAAWFGTEGAFLLIGAALISVWAYHAIDPWAPYLVIGALAILAWLALTLRRP